MTYRQTFVVEYPDASHAPPVGADMTMLGGKLVACQFDDALEEIEALLECCDAGCIAKANAMRARMTDSALLDLADDFRSKYTHGGVTFDEFDALGFASAVLALAGAHERALAAKNGAKA